MTSLEERIARCARQNLQNGQIIFFHFCPETPSFCPKMGPFSYFYKPVMKVFKRCSLLSCARRKRENCIQMSNSPNSAPQNGSFLDSCNTSHGAENSCKPVHISGSCTCTDAQMISLTAWTAMCARQNLRKNGHIYPSTFALKCPHFAPKWPIF